MLEIVCRARRDFAVEHADVVKRHNTFKFQISKVGDKLLRITAVGKLKLQASAK